VAFATNATDRDLKPRFPELAAPVITMTKTGSSFFCLK
jgi:hypothetical protein